MAGQCTAALFKETAQEKGNVLSFVHHFELRAVLSGAEHLGRTLAATQCSSLLAKPYRVSVASSR